MSQDVESGLEGVVAFATEIAPGLPPAQPHPLAVRSGDPRVDTEAALAMLGPAWGFQSLIDISDQATSIPERFLIPLVCGTGGRPVPRADWATKESAITEARARSSRACWSPARRRARARPEDARRGGGGWRRERCVKAALDRGDRLMGFGHRVYRAEDPRARVLRRTSQQIGSRRVEVAEALEAAALAELKARHPDRVLATNVEFWSAVVLDHAEVPSNLFTSLFTCARTAGWSAHILEQKREGRLIRPSAKYVGPPARPLSDV
jgi:citrate synthase